MKLIPVSLFTLIYNCFFLRNLEENKANSFPLKERGFEILIVPESSDFPTAFSKSLTFCPTSHL